MRTWFVVAPPGVLYIFSEAFSRKVYRWRRDPWVRLTVPGGGPSVEGRVTFVPADDPALESVAPAVLERWRDWGTLHLEGLRRMIRDGVNALVRIERA